MKNVPNKNIGDTLTSQEYNEGTNEELRNFIGETGQSFNDSDSNQLIQAINIMSSNRMTFKETVGSTGSAYEVTSFLAGVEPLKFLQAGAYFHVKITNENTSTTPTISFDGFAGTFNIKNKDGLNIASGFFKPNDIITFMYDGTDVLIASDNKNVDEKSVNEGNFYTVSNFSSNVYTLDSVIGNPSSYYSGLVVRFSATNKNTGNVSLKIGALATTQLLDSDNQLAEGDINENDLIEAIYANAKFNIVKKTSQLLLDSNNKLNAKNLQNVYRPFFDLSNIIVVNNPSSSYQLEAAHDKSIIVIHPNSTNLFTINLPPLSSVIDTYSVKILNMKKDEEMGIEPHELHPTDQFMRDGILTPNFSTIGAPNTVVDIYKGDQYFVVGGVGYASNEIGGISRKATQTEVNDGEDDNSFVTPYTLHNKSSLLSASQYHPIGTIIFNGDSQFNPTELPGVGSGLIWTQLPNDVVIRLVSSSGDVGIITQGSQSIDGGSTDGHAIDINEMPSHTHTINQSVSGSGGSGSGFDSGSGAITNATGGGQPHSHNVDFKHINLRAWVRTA